MSKIAEQINPSIIAVSEALLKKSISKVKENGHGIPGCSLISNFDDALLGRDLIIYCENNLQMEKLDIDHFYFKEILVVQICINKNVKVIIKLPIHQMKITKI